MSGLGDCPWCDAANTLEVEWTEMGTEHCLCAGCGKRSCVTDGRAGRSERRAESAVDVLGHLLDGP